MDVDGASQENGVEEELEQEEEEEDSLRIPIKSSNGDNDLFIEIFPDEMSETPTSTLLQVLKDENADPTTWADAALLYMQQKQAREALTILEQACELPSVTASKSHHVRILAATGIAHLSVANLAGPNHHYSSKKSGASGSAAANAAAANDPKNDLRALADAKFTNAAKLDTFWPMTWVGRGMLNLEKNQVDQARFFFQTTEKQCGPVIPALLGMAAVLFAEGDYKGAQAKYEAAIRRYPQKSGAPARVGFGLCCYKLDQVDRAKAAFARALDMDPENVEAMVSTALLDMASLDHTSSVIGGIQLDMNANRDFHARTEKAIKMMSMANLLDHSNAMVQNHLANHYFWKWTPIAGTVKVTPGSKIVVGSQNLPLDPGERIRIGNKFETTVVDYVDDDDDDNEDHEPTSFRISNAWMGTTNNSGSAAAASSSSSPAQQQPTENLKVWKKDYDRVVALARGAYSSSNVDAVRGESLFFLARVHHVREEMDNAYKFYERACKYSPDLAPARFGLAQTLIVKQEYEQAMKHLQLILAPVSGTGGGGGGASSNNASTDALALLGLLQVRNSKTLTEGLANLRKAIELDPLNPDLVIFEALALRQHEANYPIALDQYKKAIDLKKRKNVPVPYDYYANCGVLCHETKQYDESLAMYQLALQALDEAAAAAAATTGQHQNGQQTRTTAATATLQNKGIEGGRIRHVDNCMFTDFVDSLFQVQPASGENKKVLQLVPTSCLGGDDNAATSTIDMSALPLEVGDEVRLGKDFDSSIAQITQVDGGIIHLELKDEYDFAAATTTPPDENKDPDESAMQVDDEQGDKNKSLVPLFVKRENELLSIPESISVAFNIARLHEAAGRTLAAVELHKAIVKRNPSYVNSYLRLACIAVDCGSLKESSQWLQIAAKTAPGNPEVLTLIGNLHLSLADWQPAQKVFDSLLVKKISSVEAYASLSLGNIYFATLHVSEKRYAKHLQYAADYYKRILGKDPANAFAANGLGTILAEKGEIFKAKEVFNRVREVSGDNIADTLVNLGHIYLAQKKHPEALQMYKSYMKRAEDGTTPITSKSRVDDVVEVLLYIAFAYFDWARHTELFNDSNAAPADGRYKEAMNYLQLAIGKHSKREVILKYNLCMVKLQAANCVLQKLTRNIPRTVEEVQAALDGLQESLVTVEAIIKDKADGKKVLISSTTLQDFLKHCRANISSAESHLKDEKTRAESAEEERRIRRLAAEAAQKELQLKVALEREEEAKKQELRDRKADAKMRQVHELQMGWQNEQSAEQEKKTKKTKGGPKAPDVEDEPGLEVDDDDDDDGQGGGGGRRGLFDDSDDDDDAAAARPETPPKKSEAQVASQQKDLFGDSDDDDDDDNEGNDKKENKKDDDDDDDEAGESSAKEDATTKRATEATQGLFGDSDEDDDDDGGESDEEIARTDDNKKRGAAEASTGAAANDDGDQPAKKRRVLEDDDDGDE